MSRGNYEDRHPQDRNESPYSVTKTPRGAAVICGAHLVSDELKDNEAEALAAALNAEHKRKTS